MQKMATSSGNAGEGGGFHCCHVPRACAYLPVMPRARLLIKKKSSDKNYFQALFLRQQWLCYSPEALPQSKISTLGDLIYKSSTSTRTGWNYPHTPYPNLGRDGRPPPHGPLHYLPRRSPEVQVPALRRPYLLPRLRPQAQVLGLM